TNARLTRPWKISRTPSRNLSTTAGTSSSADINQGMGASTAPTPHVHAPVPTGDGGAPAGQQRWPGCSWHCPAPPRYYAASTHTRYDVSVTLPYCPETPPLSS